MIEQQYTCPKCFKDYTRFTIQEHYGCGVEPLETKPVLAELKDQIESLVEGFEVDLESALPTETTQTAEVAQPEQPSQEKTPTPEPKYTIKASEITESALMQAGFSSEDAAKKAQSEELYLPKPEPKKRGRKPKAKE
jgi:hypothetical protein